MHRPGCVVALPLLLLLGCQKPPDGFQGFKPASVEHADEGSLNRVVLTAEAEKRLGIVTTPLKVMTVARRRTVGGEVVSPPGTSASVTAPLAGTVLAPRAGAGLPLPGTVLTANQLVMRLAPLVAAGRNAQGDARAALEAARTRADNTARQAARLKELDTEGLGNQSASEAAATEAQVAQAELAAAEQRLHGLSGNTPLAADVALPLRAVQPSVLMRLTVAEGQTVAQGTPLFDLADLRTLWVRVPVYAGDFSSLDRSQAVSVQPLGQRTGTSAVSGTPVAMPAMGRPDTASVELHFQLGGAEHGLMPGQRVLVSLALQGDGEPRSVIPDSAVIYDMHGSTWSYARVGEHAYERRRIDVAFVQDGLAVLALGPAEGAEVVSVGASELFGTEFGAK